MGNRQVIEGKGYIVRRVLEDVQSVPCPCGQSIRAITGRDNDLASIDVVTIKRFQAAPP